MNSNTKAPGTAPGTAPQNSVSKPGITNLLRGPTLVIESYQDDIGTSIA